jgi:O-acetylhomoserine/O-acetylserine sulfhydrylase-like pyridoxal-dependent enzyme
MDKSDQGLTGSSQMTLSLNCKEAGDPVCTHTMYGETEEELLANAKKHGIDVHGYTEETWNEEIAKNAEEFRKLIKST